VVGAIAFGSATGLAGARSRDAGSAQCRAGGYRRGDPVDADDACAGLRFVDRWPGLVVAHSGLADYHRGGYATLL